jgi:hypothetical protein
MGMVRRGGAEANPYFWGGPTNPRSSLVTESNEASIQALLQQKIAEIGNKDSVTFTPMIYQQRVSPYHIGSAEKAYQAMKQQGKGGTGDAHTPACALMETCIHAHTHTNTHSIAYTYTNTRSIAHAHTHPRTHAPTHTHTHTHTHTNTQT